MRNIIVHNHLFKCAGSTIVDILSKNFRNNFKSWQELRSDGIEKVYQLPLLLSKYENLLAFENHHIRCVPLNNYPGVKFHHLLFLRDPVDRVYSTYKYFRKWHKNNKAESLAVVSNNSNNFHEFISNILEMPDQYYLFNFQIGELSSNRYIEPPKITDEEKFYIAKKVILEEIDALGIVERFDDCILLAEETLSKVFGELDFSYQESFLVTQEGENFQSRMNNIRNELGSRLFEHLIQLNKWDYELLKIANRKIDSMIQEIPGFNSKKQNYLQRCKKDLSKNKIIYRCVKKLFKHLGSRFSRWP